MEDLAGIKNFICIISLNTHDVPKYSWCPYKVDIAIPILKIKKSRLPVVK